MQLKPLKISEEDLKKHRQLQSVIRNAKLELKGDAVGAVSSLFAWYDKLYYLLEETIQKEKLAALPNLPEPPEEKPTTSKKAK